MKVYPLIIICWVVLLVLPFTCSISGIPEKLDHKIVCDMQGQAYLVKRHIIDTVFLERMPDVDAKCKLPEKVKP